MSSTLESTENSSFQTKNIYNRASQDVSSGIVHLIEPPLKDVKRQLNELEVKQRELIEKLHNENIGISEVQYSEELQAMFTKMKLYHSKLHSVKKDIKWLYDRGLKIKKRAEKLKEVKEKQPYEEIIVTKPINIITLKGSSSSSSLQHSD